MNFKKYHVSRNLLDVNELHEAYSFITVENGTVLIPYSTSAGQLYQTGVNVSISAPFTISFNGVQIDNSATNARVRLVFEDDTTSELYVTNSSGTARASNSGTYNKNLKAIRFNWTDLNSGFSFKNIMLNSGSTPLPYEPYTSEVWHDIPHYVHKTDTDTITTLPAVLYPNDTTATVGLKGQAVQSGTPTPQNPVTPQGCGDMTTNLFSCNIEQGTISAEGTLRSADNRVCSDDFIIMETGEYTINALSESGTLTLFLFEYMEDGTFVSRTPADWTNIPYTFSLTGKRKMKFVFAYISGNITPTMVNSIMLNTGSTPLPYSPYGYKIPISSASTTTPVYLGEIESTRRIKKLVLTGQEDWSISNNERVLYTALADHLTSNELICYCSHYKSIANVSAMSALSNGECSFNNTLRWFYIKDNNYNDATTFKTYLQQQYAAGTPVTVWYVLATPETAVVNEPLMKIGDYADEVSNVSIPVTAGGDTISVDTTVQPSKVTANYKGWHPAIAHERTNGVWT